MRTHPVAYRLVFAITLILLCSAVYAPALNRYFAGDQVYYFAELNNDRSFEAGLQRLDYSYARKYWKGDDVLFRPGLFLLLAAQNTLFGYNHVAWNLTSLVAHIACVYVLFELLLTFRVSIAAGLLALLVSVLNASLELVVWSHLSGYLVAYAMLLGSLVAIRRALARPMGPRDAIVVGSLLLGSMLFFEIAVVVAPAILLYALSRTWRHGKRTRSGWCLAVLVPLLAYASLYAWHALHAERLDYAVASQHSPVAVVTRMGDLIGEWVWSIVEPSRAVLLQGPYDRFGTVWKIKSTWWSISEIALYLVLCVGLCFSFRPRRARQWVPEIVLLLTLVLAYAALNCLGRDYAASVSYYTYFFALGWSVLLLILACSGRRLWRTLALLSVCLCVAVLDNAYLTFLDCRRIAASNRPAVRYMQQIEAIQQAHRDEEGFSFRVEGIPENLDPLKKLVVGYVDRPVEERMVRTSELLFSRYYSQDPMYVIVPEEPLDLRDPKVVLNRVR